MQKHQAVGLQNMELFSTFLSQLLEGEETSFTHSKRIEKCKITLFLIGVVFLQAVIIIYFLTNGFMLFFLTNGFQYLCDVV